jgi:hypothetical protein
MYRISMLVVALMLHAAVRAEGITVQKSEGDVKVRQGVTEVWNKVAPGDVLRPHDTMRTGPNGSAVLLVSLDAGGAAKRISLPSQVIVDMSDIRNLTQEELMLKITMEKVRASSYEWKNDGLNIPNAAVVHGEDRASGVPATENDKQVGQLLLNGARVLFDNGFYATTVLRSMEVFRMYPALGGMFDHRFLLAQAMERANLHGEALAEYSSLSRMEGLTPAQHQVVQGKMDALRAERR